MVVIQEIPDGRLRIVRSTTTELEAKVLIVPKKEFLDACRDFADLLAAKAEAS